MKKQTSKKPFTFILLWATLVVIIICAFTKCGTGTEHRANSKENESIELEKLRSLPYVDSSSIQPYEKNGVTIYKKNESYAGYSLYSTRPLAIAELIDIEGNVINTWSCPTSQGWANAELLPNGDLITTGSDRLTEKERKPRAHDPNTRRLLRFNWNGDLLWNKSIPAHHDVELTPDGNLLVLCEAFKVIPDIHRNIPILDSTFVKLDNDGNVSESKSLYDAVKTSNDIFPLRVSKVVGTSEQEFFDIFHTNSIEMMRYKRLSRKNPIYSLDNLLISIRHQDRIAILNLPENKVVWAWGQKIISGPHDASLLEDGHILLFDNGIGRNYSRVIELDPITKQIVWQYQANPPTDFYTLARGSSQRLPNGNTLIAESDKGRAFEVTKDGKIVWEFLCPHETDKGRRCIIIRMKRYPTQLIDKIIKDNQRIRRRARR